MADKERNAEIFLENELKVVSEPILWNSISKSIIGQKVICEGDRIRKVIHESDSPCRIVVSNDTTFDASRKYDGKVAVLNFASSTHVGGGVVWGASAQEESLCRCSTLYFCLNTPRNLSGFYYPHKDLNNLHNDDIIYTPNVMIFRNEDFTELKDGYREVDVITCAAPNIKDNGKGTTVVLDEERMFILFYRRFKRIFEVASHYEVEHLILGAFGCGAFGNDPLVVSQACRYAMKDFRNDFKTIEFAIYCGESGVSRNLDIFKETFDDV